MNDYRMLFEHLMKEAFDSSRCDYTFVNADYYDSGVGKHAETKAVMVCALLALSQKKVHAKDKLRQMAKALDQKDNYNDGDIDKVLDELHDAHLIN